MAKKKKKQLRPWCWYCDRDFEDDKILLQHQKQKHFKCDYCSKKLNTAGGMQIHVMQVHKESIKKVPGALPGRDSFEVEIFGMEGVPQADLDAHKAKIDGEPARKKARLDDDNDTASGGTPGHAAVYPGYPQAGGPMMMMPPMGMPPMGVPPGAGFAGYPMPPPPPPIGFAPPPLPPGMPPGAYGGYPMPPPPPGAAPIGFPRPPPPPLPPGIALPPPPPLPPGMVRPPLPPGIPRPPLPPPPPGMVLPPPPPPPPGMLLNKSATMPPSSLSAGIARDGAAAGLPAPPPPPPGMLLPLPPPPPPPLPASLSPAPPAATSGNGAAAPIAAPAAKKRTFEDMNRNGGDDHDHDRRDLGAAEPTPLAVDVVSTSTSSAPPAATAAVDGVAAVAPLAVAAAGKRVVMVFENIEFSMEELRAAAYLSAGN